MIQKKRDRKESTYTKPSKYEGQILEIVGSYGATYERIKYELRFKNGSEPSCLDGILAGMVATCLLKELENGVYMRDLLSLRQRKCLRCGKHFKSEGIHNRMCPQCKTWAASQC